MHWSSGSVGKIGRRNPEKLHVLTLTPFYPSDGDEVSGCFVAEALHGAELQGASSSVIAVDSIYHAARKSSAEFPAEWIRYPQLPGNLGLSSAGRFLGAAAETRARTSSALSGKCDSCSCCATLWRRGRIPLASFGNPVCCDGTRPRRFQSLFRGWVCGRVAASKFDASLYRTHSKVICVSQKVERC